MFCDTFRTKIKQLLRQFTSNINNNIDTALKISTNLKAFLASPVADIITALIPGDLDDQIKAKVLVSLGEIIPVLSVTKACESCVTLEDKLKCWATQLQALDPALVEAILHKLASLLAAKLGGNYTPQNLIDLYTQGKFSATK